MLTHASTGHKQQNTAHKPFNCPHYQLELVPDEDRLHT